MSGYESDTCGRSYTIGIHYVWTQIFLYLHKKICWYKNLNNNNKNYYYYQIISNWCPTDYKRKLGPIHKYLEIFVSANFFMRIQKYLRPHVAYTNRIRPSTRIRIFCIRWRHSIRTCWLILWDVRIRIGYVWTVVYDSYTLRGDADIFVSS